jgi:hypothetical protein
MPTVRKSALMLTDNPFVHLNERFAGEELGLFCFARMQVADSGLAAFSFSCDLSLRHALI